MVVKGDGSTALVLSTKRRTGVALPAAGERGRDGSDGQTSDGSKGLTSEGLASEGLTSEGLASEGLTSEGLASDGEAAGAEHGVGVGRRNNQGQRKGMEGPRARGEEINQKQQSLYDARPPGRTTTTHT